MDKIRNIHRKLMSAILLQALDDYVKMQHPKYRRKKYQKEIFWSARDIIWDPTYLLNIEDDEGSLMSLETLVKAATDRENINIGKLQKYILDRSKSYWKEKQMKTISIPEDIIIEGHAYEVRHANKTLIDFNKKIIYLDKLNPLVEEEFMRTMIDLTCHHNEIKTSGKARSELGKAIYRLLSINDCFTGDN